jgi:hypothetical protein
MDPSLLEEWREHAIQNFQIHDILNDDSNTMSYFENKTTQSLQEEILHVLEQHVDDPNTRAEICDKLAGYRFVDNLDEISLGKHLRWIKIKPQDDSGDEITLSKGGTVTGIKFFNSGSHIQIFQRYNNRRVFQYNFDNYLTFQKLSDQERIVLAVNSYKSSQIA